MPKKRSDEPKKSSAESRDELTAAIEAALGEVKITTFGWSSIVARANSGDYTSARMLISFACLMLREGSSLEAANADVVEYLRKALQRTYDAPEKIAQAFNLVNRTGRTKYENEGRDIRIVRLVSALNANGYVLRMPHPKSAFEEAARILNAHSKTSSPIGASAVKSIWGQRKREPKNPG